MTQDTTQEVTSIMIILAPGKRSVARSVDDLIRTIGKGNVIFNHGILALRRDKSLSMVNIQASAHKAGLIIDPSVRGSAILLRRPS